MPLAPRTITPMPRISTMLPCSVVVGAKSSSRQMVVVLINRMVVSGDLNTAMFFLLRQFQHHGRRVDVAAEDETRDVAAEELAQALAALRRPKAT